MEILGERVLLRPFAAADFAFYETLERDEATYAYEVKAPDAAGIAANFDALLAEQEMGRGERSRYAFLICLRADGRPVGRVGVKTGWTEIREWEVGWALRRDAWGHGYAAEAARLAIGFAFGELDAHRVIAYAHAANAASERVMLRAGMTKDGTLRGTRRWRDGWHDEILYSVLDREWAANG